MFRRAFLPALLAPALILADPGTANAAAGAAGTWPGTAICAEGSLGFTGIHDNVLEVGGWVRPCAGTDPSTAALARFGVAAYGTAAGFIYEGDVQPFPSATEPAVVRRGLNLMGLEIGVYGKLQAACVITGPTARVACVEITEQWNGTYVVEPIPTDDPRVAGEVRFVPNEKPNPECAGCV